MGGGGPRAALVASPQGIRHLSPGAAGHSRRPGCSLFSWSWSCGAGAGQTAALEQGWPTTQAHELGMVLTFLEGVKNTQTCGRDHLWPPKPRSASRPLEKEFASPTLGHSSPIEGPTSVVPLGSVHTAPTPASLSLNRQVWSKALPCPVLRPSEQSEGLAGGCAAPGGRGSLGLMGLLPTGLWAPQPPWGSGVGVLCPWLS